MVLYFCARGRVKEREMFSASTILTVHPPCSVQRPTLGRWNRMHYSCLQGTGFEVNVCIMKAVRLRIIMFYGSLVIRLSVCLPTTGSVFELYSILLFLLALLPSFTTHPHTRHSYTQTPTRLVSLVYRVCVSVVRHCHWLKQELLKGQIYTDQPSIRQPGYGSIG